MNEVVYESMYEARTAFGGTLQIRITDNIVLILIDDAYGRIAGTDLIKCDDFVEAKIWAEKLCKQAMVYGIRSGDRYY